MPTLAIGDASDSMASLPSSAVANRCLESIRFTPLSYSRQAERMSKRARYSPHTYLEQGSFRHAWLHTVAVVRQQRCISQPVTCFVVIFRATTWADRCLFLPRLRRHFRTSRHSTRLSVRCKDETLRSPEGADVLNMTVRQFPRLLA